jgi:hypothetical protein
VAEIPGIEEDQLKGIFQHTVHLVRISVLRCFKTVPEGVLAEYFADPSNEVQIDRENFEPSHDITTAKMTIKL